MCAPMIGMVFGLVAGVAQYGAAMQDYNAKKKQYNQNVVNAYAAARDEQGQLLQRELQEQEATHQKLHLSNIEQAEKRAEVEVAAAGSGVSGLSVDNILADVTRRNAFNRNTERTNFIMTAAQLQKDKEATITTAANRINSMPVPQKPSPLMILGGLG